MLMDTTEEGLSKVLKVMDKVGQFAALVDFVTRRHDALRERSWTTTKDANLGHLKAKVRIRESFLL